MISCKVVSVEEINSLVNTIHRERRGRSKWKEVEEALVKLPAGTWLEVEVPEGVQARKEANTLAGTLRYRRTGIRISTRVHYPSNRLFVSKVA